MGFSPGQNRLAKFSFTMTDREPSFIPSRSVKERPATIGIAIVSKYRGNATRWSTTGSQLSKSG
jgi:hypothetical protein